MKTLFVVSLGLFALGAYAADESLSSLKTTANDHITKKMGTLTDARSCINGASTVDAFKACKYDMKEEMKMQKMEAFEEKKEKSE